MLNPVRAVIESIGRSLARFNLIGGSQARRISDLAWPRIVTGLARMSKATADVAMVGIALGPAAIAGVGYGVPFWTMTFMLGGGIAGGTISLVSQRYGAGRHDDIDKAVKVSIGGALLVTLPLVALFWTMPEPLIRLIGTGEEAIGYGTRYLPVASLAMPFAALNLIGSRTLIGADDAWTPMIVRAGGAAVNIGLNAVLIFALDLGVVGAALGTVIGSVVGVLLLGWGLTTGSLPVVGALPVQIDWSAPYWDGSDARHLLRIATPLALRKVAQNGGQFPLLAIVGLFGPGVVAAFVIALRVRALMNTPGWGFGLASSSLVGQSLGAGQEPEAAEYAQDTFRFTLAVYALMGTVVFALADPLSLLFVGDEAVRPTTVALIRAACVSVVFWGVMNGAMGPLRATGDTTWPFYGQMLGLFVFALPAAYLGAVTPVGLWGLYGALLLETAVPAAVIYYRYQTDKWRLIGRAYRGAAVGSSA
ncbi:MATE family efflux transporter [Salinibacter sp.]|uniref:MATE family efflux transporter n=1 Tax=Salinibacter sp. TaxID=2065818 RepID=UPI0035D41CA1